MARLIIRTLAGRLLDTISLIEDLSLRPVTARLAKLLVNHALRGLAEEGLIRVDRHQIVILDRAKLAAKAQF